MAKFFNIIDSFTTGEVSPRLRGRVDLEQYNNGARTLQNFTIQPHGGVSRRTGSEWVAEVKDSSAAVRLIPFEFSTTQAYILELGNLYMRFYRNQAQITEADLTITGISKANPGVVTSVAHGLSDGDHVYITGVVGMTEVNKANIPYKVAGKTNDTFQLNTLADATVDTSAFTTYSSAGVISKIYEITTNFTTAQLNDLQFAQSNDVMYIVHNSHEVQKLTRTDHTAFSLDEVTFLDGPFLDENTTDTTLDPDGTTGSVTVTASAITGINSDTGFQTTDVGRFIRFHDGTDWTWLKITARGSTTSVTATYIGDDAGVHTATEKWRLGSFSDTTGHPGVVTFHEQRLVFGATTDQPQTIWGSLAGGIEDFSPDNSTNADEVDSDTAYTFTIGATKANVIHWLASRNELFLGTSGSIFKAQASSLNEAITPTNITIKPAVGTGAKKTLPITVQNATLFIQTFGKKVMELGFLFEDDNFTAADLTLLSEHVTGPGLSHIVRQEEPDNIIWGIDTDGDLVGMTYLRKQKVVGWHRHIIGGTSTNVESIASIPGPTQDELWFVAERTINSVTTRYIEFLSETFNGTKADMWFVDSSLSFTSTDTATISGITKANPGVVTATAHGFSDGDKVEITDVVGMTEVNGKTFTVANKADDTFELLNTDTSGNTTYSSAGTATKLVTTISGLDHLEGESVSVLADQATHPDVTVSSGAITLTRSVKTAIIGLGYTSILETNAIEQKGPLGTIQGSIGRIHKVIIRFHETLGGKFGYDTSNLDTILFRGGSDAMDTSPALFTGDKILEFPRGQETSQIVTVQQDQPLPMTVLAIITKVQVADA